MTALTLVSTTIADLQHLPLSPGRQALADAIAAVQAAQAALAEAERPCEVLHAPIAGPDRAEAELAAFQAERQRQIGAWLAGGQQGERPAPSKDETRAEHVARRARADAEAAELALPPLLARRQAALGALNAQSAQQQAASCEAAVDAAREWVDAKLRPAIETTSRAEVPLRSLQRALWLRGQGGNSIPSAAGAAGRIVQMIEAAKREAGVEHDYAAGDDLLNRLVRDPTATL
jgi:hypothetical protein